MIGGVNMEKPKKQQVSFFVDEEIYAIYKKVLIDMKLNTTQELNRHIREVIEQHSKEK
jgi:hypothetical protein